MERKYRIVKTEEMNYFSGKMDKRYHIQRKFLFWWISAMTPAIRYTRFVSGAIVTKVSMRFEDLSRCEDHLQKYFKSELTEVYKGQRIKKHYNYDNDYDTLVNLDRQHGNERYYTTRYANGDINEHKRLIDYWTSKSKTSVV